MLTVTSAAVMLSFVTVPAQLVALSVQLVNVVSAIETVLMPVPEK